MQYLITFLEGIITFISPCLLPMLPLYLTYFAGIDREENGRTRLLTNVFGFICGFTVTFILLGAFAGSIGSLLKAYQSQVNIVAGAIVVLLGLNFIGVLRLQIFSGQMNSSVNVKNLSLATSFIFGIIFSVTWTPCVGAFLGSALLLASQQNSWQQGVLLLLSYSLGLGIPFFLSALLMHELKMSFDWIKKRYTIINTGAGILLLIMGILMMTGQLERLNSWLIV